MGYWTGADWGGTDAYQSSDGPRAAMDDLSVDRGRGPLLCEVVPVLQPRIRRRGQHSIGKSILMGKAGSAPAPSWDAALDYALAYGNAIWQAMVLGLLLGSAVQALIPPQWVARALGKTRLRQRGRTAA